MNQPPQHARPPAWRRPPGVTAGVWEYVHQRSIADRYQAFVADTPLCRLDEAFLQQVFPGGLAVSQRILDLGCGNGRSALGLLARGYTVIGVDLSQRMLELMWENAVAAELQQHLLPVRANIVDLSCLADQSTDHVVCMFSTLGMIHARTHRRAVLQEAHRVARPGGKLVLHVHHRWAAVWEAQGATRLARSAVRCIWDRDHEFGDATYEYRGLSEMFLHRFSRRELVADLQRTRWQVEAIHPISLDGSRLLESSLERRFRAGGFFVVARHS